MSRHTECDAKYKIPAMLVELPETEAAIVLRGIYLHLLSMLADVLILINTRLLRFFDHIHKDT